MSDQTQIRVLHAPRAGVYGVTFLPVGSIVVSASHKGVLRFWKPENRLIAEPHSRLAISYGAEAMAELGPEGFVPGRMDPRAICRSGIAFAPDSLSFIVPNRDGTLEIWNARTLARLGRLELLGTNNWGVASSPDGRWLAVGEVAGRVSIWDWTARKAVARFAVPFECYGKLFFSASGRYLVARVLFQDMSQTYRLWRVSDWSEVGLGVINQGILSADLSKDDGLMAAGYSDQRVRVWEFPAGKLRMETGQQPTSVNAVAFAPDGRTLASASTDGTVKLWDVRARQEIGTLRQDLGLIWATSFSADGRRLLLGGNSTKNAVEIWDVAARKQLLTLAGEGLYFVDVAFSPDGNTIQASSLDGKLHLWHAPSWEGIAQSGGGVSPPARR